MDERRVKKVNELIRKISGEFLAREVDAPGVLLTATRVDTSSDMRYARIFVSIFPENRRGSAAEKIQKRQKDIQSLLYKEMHTKPIPKISFVFDETERKADKVEKILRDLRDGS